MKTNAEMEPMQLLRLNLSEACKAADAAEDEKERLEAAIDSFRAVLHFLLSDPDIAGRHLTRALAPMLSAAHDSGRGAEVPLLAHAPATSRPTSLIRDHFKAHTAVAMEFLTSAKMGTERAGQWLAAEARAHGLCSEDGSPVTAKALVAGWRELRREDARAASVEAKAQFRTLIDRYKARLKAPVSDVSLPGAKRSAQAIIKNLANLAPRDAPKAARRVER